MSNKESELKQRERAYSQTLDSLRRLFNQIEKGWEQTKKPDYHLERILSSTSMMLFVIAAQHRAVDRVDVDEDIDLSKFSNEELVQVIAEKDKANKGRRNV